VSIFINFGRIYRAIAGNVDEIALLYKNLTTKIDEYINFLLNSLNFFIFIDKSDFLTKNTPSKKFTFYSRFIYSKGRFSKILCIQKERLGKKIL